jgi:TolA-binding protein
MRLDGDRFIRRTMSVVAVFGLTVAMYGADDNGTANGTNQGDTSKSGNAQQVQDLKQQLTDQQKQIEELRLLLLDQKKQIDNVANAQSAAPVEEAPAKTNVGDVATVAPIVPPLPAAAVPNTPIPPTPAPPTPAPPDPPQKEADGFTGTQPLTFKLGDTLITPIGFMDLTNTYRSTNAGTSLQTNFGSIPYNNGVTGRLSEDKLSAANSRIGFRTDTNVKGWDVMGYWESDFVGGVGDTQYNTQVSSNSLIFRIRQYYVTMRKNKFEFQAGQSWSMMTPNRVGISPLPQDLFYSQVVDVNYMNGLTWGRIPGVRFLFHPSEKVTWGLSLENSSQYFGGSGGASVPLLPSALTSSIASELDQNVSNGVKTPNVAPDVISKIAFDPISRVHLEIDGVVNEVKLSNPTTLASFTKAGAGGSFNGNLVLFPGFRLIFNTFWSDGDGRYIFGEAPDFIVRSDGSISMMHSGSTVDGFEYQHGNSQFYAYYGGVTIERDTALDANGKTPIGWGYVGSSNAQNRTTQEGTIGWTQTWWRDPKYGAFQTMLQFAYFFRDPWYVAAGAPKNTHEDTVFFNIRYLLPGQAPSVHY